MSSELLTLDDFRASLSEEDRLIFEDLLQRIEKHEWSIRQSGYDLPYLLQLLTMIMEKQRERKRLAAMLEDLQKEKRALETRIEELLSRSGKGDRANLD